MASSENFASQTLQPFTESVWTAATPVRFAGIWFPHVMSVIRLSNDQLLLHSPCRPSQPLLRAIGNLGQVTHVVAPNWFHDLYLAEYRTLYPSASFWGPAVLRRRLGEKFIVGELNETTRPPWYLLMPHITLSGLLTFDESVFFHAPSGTLIVADLFMNLTAEPSTPRFTRLMYRFSGVQGRLSLPPYLRWFGVTARRPLRAAFEQIGRWKPERLIVGHGKPVPAGAMEQLRAFLPR
jgi:hypothetical protein